MDLTTQDLGRIIRTIGGQETFECITIELGRESNVDHAMWIMQVPRNFFRSTPMEPMHEYQCMLGEVGVWIIVPSTFNEGAHGIVNVSAFLFTTIFFNATITFMKKTQLNHLSDLTGVFFS